LGLRRGEIVRVDENKMKIAFIFPGQGAQFVGMGKTLVEQSAAAKATFAEAEKISGLELTRIAFEGPQEELDRTDVSQPAIFTHSVACYRALQEAGKFPGEPLAGMAGLSLGEYTALWAAGVFDFETGLRLVQKRGQLMQAAAEAEPSGMVSIIGLTPEQVETLCRDAAEGQVLVPANFNCPGQVVVSGTQAGCQRILDRVEQAEGRAVPLRVAGAFHSPLMQSAADGLKKELEGLDFSPTKCTVLANVSGQPYPENDPDAIREGLIQQVATHTRWEQCVRRLLEMGVETFYEIGPGRVLKGLMRKIDRKVKCVVFDQLYE